MTLLLQTARAVSVLRALFCDYLSLTAFFRVVGFFVYLLFFFFFSFLFVFRELVMHWSILLLFG